MSIKISRVASIAFAMLLVSSAVVSPVGTAAAAEQGNCSDLDDFVMFLTLGAVNAEDCSRQAYVEDAIEDMEQSDANQTKVDIYSAASGSKAGRQAWAAPYDNYLNDTESVAWMKAQNAVAEAYQNGSTKAEAKVAAKEAIAEYYATKQLNLIEQWNVSVTEFARLKDIAQQESDISGSGLNNYVPEWTANNGDSAIMQFHNNGDTEIKTVTLVNGDSQAVEAVRIGFDEAYSPAENVVFGPATGNTEICHDTDCRTVNGMMVKKPDSNYERLHYMEFDPFAQRWAKIEGQNTALQSEAENFVNATWSDFDSGQINASDVIGSNTAMFEYGVRSGNETEGLYNSVGALALMGFDTPNVSDSGVMTVTHNGVTYEGLVLAENAPNGTWTAGQTYNTSNITGPVFMATTDGNKVDFANNTEFTVDSMTAKDGSSLGSIDTTRYSYKTANTSELLAMQDQLSALRAEIEARQLSSTSGGGGSSGGSLPTKYLLFALAAGAAYVLFVEPDGDGGGRY